MNLLKEHRADVLRLVTELGGRNVRVFGSVARGEADEQSDIDLLVSMEMAKNALQMRGEKKAREIEQIKIRAADMAGEAERLRHRGAHIMIEELLRPSQRRNILEQAVPL